MLWAAAIIITLVALAAGGMRYAISQNGPAVLDTVDRIAGGTRDVARLPIVQYGDHPAQKLFIHRPRELHKAPAAPVLIFFHGGSWRSGDPQYYDFVGRSFGAEGLVVVNAGYRLGEDGRWPVMLEDSAAAVAWVYRTIADFGGDPENIFLMGHSAGAYNVAMLGLDRQWLGREGLEGDAIKGVIGIAGPYDFYPFDSESTIAAFGEAPRPEATQPVNHGRADAPPFMLFHGEEDTLVKPRNSRALEEVLADAGGSVTAHYYADMEHNAPLLALATPWAGRRDIVAKTVSFIETAQTSVPVQP